MPVGVGAKHFSTLLTVARVITLDYFLSLSVSLSLQYPFSLSRSFPLCLSLTLSLVVSCLLARFPSFFFSICERLYLVPGLGKFGP